MKRASTLATINKAKKRKPTVPAKTKQFVAYILEKVMNEETKTIHAADIYENTIANRIIEEVREMISDMQRDMETPPTKKQKSNVLMKRRRRVAVKKQM